MTEETIFAHALDKADPAERAAFLDDACRDHPDQRRRVEALLFAHEQAGEFLDHPAVAPLHDPNALTQAEAESNGDEAVGAVKEDLSFLEPSNKPGSIGRLGHYEVLKVLGHGGFGIVLKAFDETLHRVVAVKVLSPQMAATSPARKRFLREARAAAAVRHENVVPIHAIEEQPIPHIVMDFIPGETLQNRLDRVGPLDVAEVVKVGIQLARGLAAAHEKGLIHRDIKPANVLVEKGIEEKARLTDFGLARAADDASMTQSGQVAGTPLYMAPEQARGESLDYRADLFSLGSVLYALCSGRPPFRAESTLAVLKRVSEDAARPIREIIPEVPQWLCDVIARLHAKKPEERYQSAQEVADLLVQYQAQPPAPVPPVVAPPRRFSRKILLAASVVMGAALVTLGVYAATRPRPAATHSEAVVAPPVVHDCELTVASDEPVHLVIKRLAPQPETLVDADFTAGSHTVPARPGKFALVASVNGQVIWERTVELVEDQKQEFRVVASKSSVPVVKSKDMPQGTLSPFDATKAKKSQQEWADYLGVKVEFTNSIGVEMCVIPPGDFIMGSSMKDLEERYDMNTMVQRARPLLKALTSEMPPHPVRITRPFALGKTEVTVKQFRQFVEEEKFTTTAEDQAGGWGYKGADLEQAREFNWKNPGYAVTDQSAVWNVSWSDADKFCKWLSKKEGKTYRLPTEAEWEYACRAGTTTRYYWGVQPSPQYGWGPARGEGRPRAVGEKPANPWGLHDMAGNVWEWCHDWHAADYYANSPAADPTGPASATGGRPFHVHRGGGVHGPIDGFASTFRSPTVQEIVGFRVLCEIGDAALPPPVPKPLNPEAQTAARVKVQQEAWAKHLGLTVEFKNSVRMEMRVIPPGEFQMGSSPEEIEQERKKSDPMNKWFVPEMAVEQPKHLVRLTRPFALGLTEVTVAQFRAFAVDKGYKTTCEKDGKGGWGFVQGELVQGPQFNWENVGEKYPSNAPVWNVSWEDATAFCAWLSAKERAKYRLPTEAEWEYACRAGTTTRCYWGEETRSAHAWVRGNQGLGVPHPVGKKPPNAFGLLDMCGNVAEWCQDRYLDGYYKVSPTDDPQGPVTGTGYVFRGGRVEGPVQSHSSTYRAPERAKLRMIGFRVVMEIERK